MNRFFSGLPFSPITLLQVVGLINCRPRMLEQPVAGLVVDPLFPYSCWRTARFARSGSQVIASGSESERSSRHRVGRSCGPSRTLTFAVLPVLWGVGLLAETPDFASSGVRKDRQGNRLTWVWRDDSNMPWVSMGRLIHSVRPTFSRENRSFCHNHAPCPGATIHVAPPRRVSGFVAGHAMPREVGDPPSAGVGGSNVSGQRKSGS